MSTAQTLDLVARLAKEVALDPAALMAVIEVESEGRAGTMINGRQEPLIRFEGHYFDRRLPPEKQEIARREGLASPTAGAVKNPPSQAARWRMLDRAAAIDRKAAYEATSWGIGQVMGAHWAWLGYASVEALVEEARGGVEGQARLMLRYIEKAGLLDPLRRHDWAAFARGYNGPAYTRNSYHLRLSLAYRRHARTPGPAISGDTEPLLRRGSRGSAVAHLQSLLAAAGYPIEIDGVFGPETLKVVLAFQRHHGLDADGIAGPATISALEHALPFGSSPSLWARVVGLARRFAKAFSG